MAGLLLLAAGLCQSLADTPVCGLINTDHWTKAGSPYLATCDVVVLGSLTIDPGVWVLFQSNNVFQVNGLLTAVGTADDPICFTRANGPGGWQGIYFNYASPASQLAYCAVSNSVNSGIRIQNSGPTKIQSYLIANNSTTAEDGSAGGITASSGLLLSQCSIVNNSGLSKIVGVGGVSVVGKAILQNCTISRNSGTFCGGLLSSHVLNSYYDLGAAVTLVNCVFSWNTGDGANLTTDATFTNCTFAYNSRLGLEQSSCWLLAVANCIFYFNGSSATELSVCVPLDGSVTYCDVHNGYPGIGNFDFDPKFVSASDFHLLPASPCIDTGNPDPASNDSCLPPSMGGLRNDMGAYGGPGACGWVSGAAPVIVAQPQSQSSCLGQSASFQVLATGSPPLSYQWFFNGTPLTGQTSTNLVLTNLVSSQAGAYSVVVSNAFGSVTSAPVQLVVNDACVDLRMYAGLNIAGQPGAAYVLSYTTNLTAPINWFPLATNAMPSSGWFYLDMDSSFSPERFYRVQLKP